MAVLWVFQMAELLVVTKAGYLVVEKALMMVEKLAGRTDAQTVEK